MHRFYVADIADTLMLPEDESRHCVKVLRLVEGDEIEVVDGRGTCYVCRIALAHHKRCMVSIESSVQMPTHWGHEIVLAVAPTKNLDRIEWMTEKVVEMGVDRIVPLLCQNSERKVLKTERLSKIMVSAMKQSLKAVLPRIDEITPVQQLIDEPFDGQRFIAYCDASLPRESRKILAQEYVSGSNVLMLIGPEGDFSPVEVKRALAAGFVPVTLGESRLRTETAATMACATFHVLDMANNK